MTNGYTRLSVEELAERCRKETSSRNKEPGLVGFCFELFRRAIVENCQEAWDAIYVQYRREMSRWAGSSPFDADELVHRTFEKFLNAVTPSAFARFTGIGSIRAYLRRCVKSVLIDHWRQAAREQRALDALGLENPPAAGSPEQMAFDRTVNRQCADRVYSRLKGRKERLIVRLNLELGLKPTEIVQLYPAEFPTTREVKKVRDRLIYRFSEDPILRNLWSTDLEKRS
jgi:DNA-directed RNA polymerase specialized sigma24 family protein